MSQPMIRSEAHFYQNLTRRIISTILIVSFTPMILATVILLYQFREAYIEKTNEHLVEVVMKHKQNIDAFLKERLSNLRFLSANRSIEELIDEPFLQEKLNLLKREYGLVFTDLGLINDEGIQMAYAGPFNLANARYSEAAWFHQAIKTSYYISDVFLGLRGHPHFIIAVRHTYRGRYWILRATIDFAAFNSLVENLRVGKTGIAFLINKEGQLQTKPSFDVSPEKIDYLLKISQQNDSEFHVFRDSYEGGEHVFVTAFLKNHNWLLIFQQDTNDALADVDRTAKIAAVIFLLGACAILLMALILSRRIVRIIRSADKKNELMQQQVVETGKLASLGELAAGIAHEINNPVAIMVEEAGWIGDLLEEEDLRQSSNLEEFQKSLRQIHTQGKRCKDITHKLLSFARKTDSQTKDVQVNDLITEIVALSAQMAKYNRVDIRTHLQKDIPRLNISPSEMQQVLLNMINNSLYALEKRGGVIDITSKQSQDQVFIDIADNGPGIPESILPRIFDPFFTTKPVGKGTGLGLSICFGIIQKMGGDITVNSAVDIGTRFRIKLPLKAGTQVAGAASAGA
ncbi:MAG: sensor histidine kinase [Thermodesulfobacteriota bacterium]